MVTKSIPVDPQILISKISAMTNLHDLDELLTEEMAHQRIQALIKAENLDVIVDSILRLAKDVDQQEKLAAAAMLGRLAAVARGRPEQVFGKLKELNLLPRAHVDSLSTGVQKTYAAQAIAQIDASWVADYCIQQAFDIESANNARRELLNAALLRAVSVEEWLKKIADRSLSLSEIENLDSRITRAKWMLTAMLDVLRGGQADLGLDPGIALGKCVPLFTRGSKIEGEKETLHVVLDLFLEMLARLIEMRFSYAFKASTYVAVSVCRKTLGVMEWNYYLRLSKPVASVRIDLLETALVLARQNKTDKEIVGHLIAVFETKHQLISATRKHFFHAEDLDPEIRNWWINGGATDESNPKKVEQRIGNTEDEQIGSLLLEVESNRIAMEKIGRAVVPFLEISDPVLASTVRKAATGYSGIAQIVRRLARMRKLTLTELQGAHIEYNPLEHEMLGGHKSGIRRVRVIRDGVKKDFSGRIKTLVKPWVEPENI